MRVISGIFKKKKLLLPDSKLTRPLRDYVKENIFNLLTHSNKVSFEFEKSKILDIFSGSGSFGIECISRGSSKIFFVEKEKKVLNILNNNIKNLIIKNQCTIIAADALDVNLINICKENLDLIFLDPPYNFEYFNEFFSKLNFCKKYLLETLIIIHIENKNNYRFDDFIKIIFKKKYGRSVIIFGKIKN